MPPVASQRRTLGLLALALIVATLLPYLQVTGHQFLSYDDDKFLVDNAAVRHGVDAELLRWAFTNNHASLWLPVTWISHALDFALFGDDSGAHHLVNLLQHVINTLLLLWLGLRLTGRLWLSALVAALFALHPSHVESVAWVTERKDTLSTLFMLLMLLAWERYARSGSRGAYLLAVVACGLGLMAKPMLVTVPLLLLVLDLWPLARLQAGWRRLVVEKIPFVLLAGATAVVTFLVGRAGGIVAGLDALPLIPRLTNALVSTATYPLQMFWPFGLRAQYVFRQVLPLWQIGLAGLFLGGMTLLAIRWWRRRPWFAAGWAWYLVSLVPVSGVLQQGSHAMADRYTYTSLLGLFAIVAWGGAELLGQPAARRRVATAVAVVWLIGLGFLTWRQAAIWRDSVTLFEHAVALAPDDPLARSFLGGGLAAAGRHAEAVQQYRAALSLKHGDPQVCLMMARSLVELGDVHRAVLHFQEARKGYPDEPGVHFDLGVQEMLAGNLVAARESFARVLELDPAHASALTNLGLVLLQLGQPEQGTALLARRIELTPENAAAHYNLACGLSRSGRLDEAAAALRRAVDLGFTSWDHMDADPDLAALRATEAYRQIRP